MRKFLLLLVVFPILFSAPTFGQKKSEEEKPVLTTRILFLLDASGSMVARWERNSRMSIAKNLLSEIMDSLKNKENVEVALRVYGHQSPKIEKDCKDTRLEVPFYKGNHAKIISKLKYLTPKGATPIAYSLQEAANDFPKDPNSRNIIIIITDGIESCDGDPCAVSYALQKNRIVLKPFIIGLGMDLDVMKAFGCVGTYFEATLEAEFQRVLKTVVAQALNTTTVQVNLLSKDNLPIETNVAMTFYDSKLAIERYNFVHTLNSKGKPDTLMVDPANLYDIHVHTNPMVKITNVSIAPGKHTTVEIKAPMGLLDLSIGGFAGYKNLKAIVRKEHTFETIADQEFNTSQKYIIGKYDLEFTTLPVIKFNSIEILQSKTYKIQIPQPGFVSMSSYTEGYGSIFVLEGSKLKKIYDLNSSTNNETVTIQPGTYKVIYRSKNSTSSVFTKEKEFTVKSGITTSINLLD